MHGKAYLYTDTCVIVQSADKKSRERRKKKPFWICALLEVYSFDFDGNKRFVDTKKCSELTYGALEA